MDIQGELEWRKEQVGEIIELAGLLSKPGGEFAQLLISTTGGSAGKVVVLRSTIVIMLYSAMEATVTSCLRAIHNEASGSKFTEISQELQCVWLDYSSKKEVFGICSGQVSFPTLTELQKRVRLYNWNIDFRQIENVMQKYGIGKLNTDSKDIINRIKSIRNEVSHGTKSFHSAAQMLTDSELGAMRDAVFETLQEVVDKTEVYLKNREFLK